MSPDQALTIVVSVVASVATLLLISIGLAVIFGLMRVINLAHGEFLMLGAYAVLVGTRLGVSLWIAIPLAGLAVGIFGLVVEWLLIRPLYGRILDTLLATWGLSLVLVQAVSIVFGPATNGIGTPLGSVRVGSYSFSQYSLVLIVMVDDILRTERRQGRDRPRWRSVSELPPLAAQVSGKQS